MIRLRERGRPALAQVLLDVHRRATSAAIVERAALHLVRLSEPAGLSLALAVHHTNGGPDPAVLCGRAAHAGVHEPLMAAAVRVDALTSALEGLTMVSEADRHLLGWAVRELHHCGEVPVLLVLDGTAYATSLSAFTSQDKRAESFAWSLPAIGEA